MVNGGVPRGSQRVVTNLVVRGGGDAIAFYERALGAETLRRFDGPGGVVYHSELRLGDTVVMVSDEWPDLGLRAPDGSRTCSVMVWGPDCDAAFARAVAAGATEVSKPQDTFSGDRIGAVVCPFGHRWVFATKVEEISDEEMRRRIASFSGG